ncbi:MAG: glutathione S-transferase family protein [Candidatus Puniceispirillales bacterium]
MILRSADASPFGRMVKLAAHVLGRIDEITVEPSETANPDDTITSQNPLGKIPALIVGNRVIYDSRTILDYLDMEAGGGRIIPASGEDRLDVQIRCARVNGILDAALLVVYERRYRPEEMVVESFVERQRDKIRRGLDVIAAENRPYTHGAMPQVDEIGLACVLDYLDLRQQLDWRDHCPAKESWITDFAAQVPGYHATLPTGINPAPWRER